MYLETTSGAQFSAAQAITTTADATNLFDVTGAGVGTLPAMIGAGGLNTALGYDVGAGEGVAVPSIIVSPTVTGTGAGTVTISLSAAPDNGSGSAGTYTQLYASRAITGTTLLVGNSYIFPVPPILPGEALPRFYKLTYTVSGSATVTVNAWLSFNIPTTRDATLYGENFVAV